MGIDIYLREGLIRAADLTEAGDDTRYLRDEARRGALIRIRRGFYVPALEWRELDPFERHLAQARAALEALNQPLVIGGRSAAALWRLPGAARWPQQVTLIGSTRGGGQSSPGVRLVSSATSIDRHLIGGLPCTSLARTAIDVARVSTFPDAVAVIDAARDRRRADRTELSALDLELYKIGRGRGVAMARRAVGFSTDRSESAGETRARTAIHRLGFQPPELQRRFTDSDGDMYPDFFWPDVEVAAEYDGKMKYTRREFTGGDPSEVVWREKKREDRLRRQVRRVERIVTFDVENPSRLDAILRAAGVPLRTGVRRVTV